MAGCSNTFRLSFMLGLVLVYFLVELITGYIVHSLALVADAFHMLSDFIALCVGIAAIRISKWPRSSKNTFGWQRAEVLGSLINLVVLVTLCFTILVDAIKRFIEKSAVENPKIMTFVGIGGLAINILGLVVIGSHSHSHGDPTLVLDDEEINLEESVKEDAQPDTVLFAGEHEPLSVTNGKIESSNLSVYELSQDLRKPQKFACFSKTHTKEDDIEHQNCHLSKCRTDPKKNVGKASSMNMRAVFLHVFADFLGSIIVVVSALILWLTPGDPNDPAHVWKLYVDPAMSVILVGIILWSTIPLLLKAALILLQSVPNEICIRNLQNRLEKIPGILKVHDLHVWKLQSNCIIGSVHIRCQSLPDYVNVAKAVKKLFHEYNVHCTTIQPEFEDSSNVNALTCLYDCGPDKNCQNDSCCPAAVVTGGLTGRTTATLADSISDRLTNRLAMNNNTYESSTNNLETHIGTGDLGSGLMTFETSYNFPSAEPSEDNIMNEPHRAPQI